MSINITRPTSTTLRTRFAALSTEQRAEVKALAVKASDRAISASEAWAAAFARFDSETVAKSSGVAGKHFQRAVGHRLADLRSHTASCTCGKAKYKGEDLRGQHASHKAKVAA